MRTIINITIMFICVSCNSQPKSEKDIRKAEPNILEIFTKSHPSDLICDSNSLIFYVSKSFDTSYVIQINYNDTLNNALCYYVTPELHIGLFSNKRKPFFFHGFGFYVDSNKWNYVGKYLKEKKMADIKSSYNISCLDCNFVYISTNGVQKSGYVTDNDTLFEIEKFIKRVFFDMNIKK